MIPRCIFFSSNIPNNLGASSAPAQGQAHYHSLSHRLDTNTPLVREEYEDLLLGIVLGVREEVELAATTHCNIVSTTRGPPSRNARVDTYSTTPVWFA